MQRFILLFTLTLGLSSAVAGCTIQTIPRSDSAVPPWAFDGGRDGAVDAAARPDAGVRDAGELSQDAACSSATVTAETERLPVDIIFMVDNSISMDEAIAQVQSGLNNFAAMIGDRELDYRVIMLSMRGVGLLPGPNPDTSSDDRYQVCVPEPLAGAGCADNAPLFYHVEMDVRSTQQHEQILGTLAQTSGYRATVPVGIGSEPWLDLLRPDATKTFVIVTDDNARMVNWDGSRWRAPSSGGDPSDTADWFEQFPGGANPWNSSRDLGQGLLHTRWGGLFDGYVFSAIYGWGSETDPDETCELPSPEPGFPAASGLTYTELVERTGGVRAQICDDAAAWTTFFEDVASAVERASRIACEQPIPEPPEGMFFDRDRINVFLTTEGVDSVRIGRVADGGSCDSRGGWYYDDPTAPTHIVLCPDSCDEAQSTATESKRLDLQFGCQSIPI